MQSIAQMVSGLAGLRTGEVQSIAPVDDEHARARWLHDLGTRLTSQAARELTYAFVFLTSVADLQLTSTERDTLEELQHALRLDHQRATDLVVFLTSVVAGSGAAA